MVPYVLALIVTIHTDRLASAKVMAVVSEVMLKKWVDTTLNKPARLK